jgi:hypothetical protein
MSHVDGTPGPTPVKATTPATTNTTTTTTTTAVSGACRAVSPYSASWRSSDTDRETSLSVPFLHLWLPPRQVPAATPGAAQQGQQHALPGELSLSTSHPTTTAAAAAATAAVVATRPTSSTSTSTTTRIVAKQPPRPWHGTSISSSSNNNNDKDEVTVVAGTAAHAARSHGSGGSGCRANVVIALHGPAASAVDSASVSGDVDAPQSFPSSCTGVVSWVTATTAAPLSAAAPAHYSSLSLSTSNPSALLASLHGCPATSTNTTTTTTLPPPPPPAPPAAPAARQVWLQNGGYSPLVVCSERRHSSEGRRWHTSADADDDDGNGQTGNITPWTGGRQRAASPLPAFVAYHGAAAPAANTVDTLATHDTLYAPLLMTSAASTIAAAPSAPSETAKTVVVKDKGEEVREESTSDDSSGCSKAMVMAAAQSCGVVLCLPAGTAAEVNSGSTGSSDPTSARAVNRPVAPRLSSSSSAVVAATAGQTRLRVTPVESATCITLAAMADAGVTLRSTSCSHSTGSTSYDSLSFVKLGPLQECNNASAVAADAGVDAAAAADTNGRRSSSSTVETRESTSPCPPSPPPPTASTPAEKRASNVVSRLHTPPTSTTLSAQRYRPRTREEEVELAELQSRLAAFVFPPAAAVVSRVLRTGRSTSQSRSLSRSTPNTSRSSAGSLSPSSAAAASARPTRAAWDTTAAVAPAAQHHDVGSCSCSSNSFGSNISSSWRNNHGGAAEASSSSRATHKAAQRAVEANHLVTH